MRMLPCQGMVGALPCRDHAYLGLSIMKIAITGGTGFIGGRLARALISEGHEAVLIARGKNREHPDLLKLPSVSFARCDIANLDEVRNALRGCEVVAHCAGINREKDQSYEQVHQIGTNNVITAARELNISKVVSLGFLRARPGTGMAYHQSKWEAEEIVRSSGVNHVIIKAGMNYGAHDHFLHHLSRALRTFPIIALLGIHEQLVRPIAVEDLLRIFKVAIYEKRLDGQTVPVMGPDTLTLNEVIRTVAQAVDRHPSFVRIPFFVHHVMARFFEYFMTVPLISRAQVEMFSEGLAEAAGSFGSLPEDLEPRTRFSPESIRYGLPAKKPFGLKYCLVCIAIGGNRTGRCPVREQQG